jgi:hypothetical protein
MEDVEDEDEDEDEDEYEHLKDEDEAEGVKGLASGGSGGDGRSSDRSSGSRSGERSSGGRGGDKSSASNKSSGRRGGDKSSASDKSSGKRLIVDVTDELKVLPSSSSSSSSSSPTSHLSLTPLSSLKRRLRNGNTKFQVSILTLNGGVDPALFRPKKLYIMYDGVMIHKLWDLQQYDHFVFMEIKAERKLWACPVYKRSRFKKEWKLRWLVCTQVQYSAAYTLYTLYTH